MSPLKAYRRRPPLLFVAWLSATFLLLAIETTTVTAARFSVNSSVKTDKANPSTAQVEVTITPNKKNKNAVGTEFKPREASNSKLLQSLGFADLSAPESIMLGLAITLVFTRIIPKQDILFSIAYPLYIGVINRVRFQRNEAYLRTKNPKLKQPVTLLWQTNEIGPWFKTYMLSFAWIGIFLPLIFLFAAPMSVSSPAVAHTYLLLIQVVTEGLSKGAQMHVLPKLMVPIGFNTYRMVPLWKWVKSSGLLLEKIYTDESVSSPKRTQAMVVIGFFLGVVNLIVWAYNLFIFLVLRVSPQYLDTVTFPTAQISWKRQLWPVSEQS